MVEAIQQELQKFKNFGVYNSVPYKGQEPLLTSGWVVTEKIIGGELGCKARLVVHGNQDTAEIDVDSPTVQKSSLRLQITIAAQYGWELKTSDVTSAFLQSDNLD